MNSLYTLRIKHKDTGRVLRTYTTYPQSVYFWEKAKIEQIKRVCDNHVLDKSDLIIEEEKTNG